MTKKQQDNTSGSEQVSTLNFHYHTGDNVCPTCGGPACPHCGKALPVSDRNYQPIWIAPWYPTTGYPWWQVWLSTNTTTITVTPDDSTTWTVRNTTAANSN